MKSSRARVKHAYITRKKGVSGGKPVIAGTRIKVAQIALEYERMGWTADEIVQAHPHLTLAQVHDALAYYYDNAQEINTEIRNDEEFVQALQAEHPQSVLEEKRGRAKNLHR
jgi:uncharacterized protein (DUF433 family)